MIWKGQIDYYNRTFFGRARMPIPAWTIRLCALLPFCVVLYCNRHQIALDRPSEAINVSIVIEYYPGLDQDLEDLKSPQSAGAGRVVLVEVMADRTLRYRDLSDLSRSTERQLEGSEFDRLKRSVRAAIDSLRCEGERMGPIIDFDRVCVSLAYGQECVDRSFNLGPQDFFSESSLWMPGRGLRRRYLEIEKVRSDLVRLCWPKKNEGR